MPRSRSKPETPVFPDGYLSRIHAAAYYDKCVDYIDKLSRNGVLHPFKLPGSRSVFFSKAELDSVMRAGRVAK